MNDGQHASITDLCTALGGTVIQLQTTERVIASALQFLFPEGGFVTLATLAQSEKERRMALGPLLKRLRSRVHVDPSFDEDLARFLERRNTTIHDLMRIPGFSPGNSATYQLAMTYLVETMDLSKSIASGLAGLILTWGDAIGMQRPPELGAFLKEIERDFDPRALGWFRSK